MTTTSMLHRLRAVGCVALALVAFPCGAKEAATIAPTTVEGLLNSTDTCPPNWSYEGANGPAEWATMPGGYPACGETVQSPVNLHKFTKQKGAALQFDYTPAAWSVRNTMSSYQIGSTGFGTANLPNGPWTLKQFHFHFPSEHKVNGKRFKGEVHLVHQNTLAQIAVVAVFIDDGTANGVLQPIIDGRPSACNVNPRPGTFDPTGLLPSEASYFQYSGTLTTPPCTDDVAWYVMQTPIQASSSQIKLLQVIANNARPYAHNVNPVTFNKVP